MTSSNEELCLPAVPDDDADFTPDLARKIIEKYQAIVSRLAAQSGGEVRVKPLEWVLDPDRQKDTPKWRAVDATGLSYEIFKAWWGHQQDWGFVALGEFHRTEEAAKAAAQADFERRIRSALVSPTSAPASVAAMKEALVPAMREAISCINDLGSGKGGWAWEEVVQQLHVAIDKIDVAASAPSDAVREAHTALAFAENMISKHIEEFHDFDYEPHQVPPELAQLRAIQHHLLGSLTGENGESVLREKNHLTASEGNAAPGVSQQTVAEGIARIIDPEAFEDHFAYQKAANMRKRALVATATANAILSAYPLRDAQQPLGDVFNELVRRMNFDGMNPRTFTLGELRDAIDGAELPK